MPILINEINFSKWIQINLLLGIYNLFKLLVPILYLHTPPQAQVKGVSIILKRI